MGAHKPLIAGDFGRAAATYAHFAGLQREVAAHLLTRAAPHIPSGATLLDIGCGPGTLYQLSREQRIDKDWRWLQCDLSVQMCCEARRQAGAAHAVLAADAEALPLRDASADAALSSMTLHWTDIGRAAQEMRRLLRSGGIVALALPIEGSLGALRESFTHCGRPDSIARFPSLATIKRALSDAGMHVMAVEMRDIRHDYADLSALLAALRAIGGQNKQAASRRRYAGRDFFRAAESHYRRHHADECGLLPASWRIGFFLARDK